VGAAGHFPRQQGWCGIGVDVGSASILPRGPAFVAVVLTVSGGEGLAVLKGRVGGALFALAWFWIWAAHVATGLLDGLVASRSGPTSGIVGALDSVTDAILIRPLGRPLAAAVLAILGVGIAAFLYRPTLERAR